MRNAKITGWGKALPKAVLSNHDIESLIDTNDDWITTRTGIKERRISHVETSDMAAIAGTRAIAAAGLEADDIDLIILATCSADTVIPAAAAMVPAGGSAAINLPWLPIWIADGWATKGPHARWP